MSNEVQTPQTATQSAVAQIAADEQQMAKMHAEIQRLTALTANITPPLPKRAPSDEEMAKAMASLAEQAKADLANESPKASGNLSLSSVLGFIPTLSKEQRAAWAKVRDAIRSDYSDKHRELFAHRKAILARVMRNPKSLVSTSAKQRKDGTHSRVSLSAKEPAKAKRRKVTAKPAQVAAHVPTPGNANPPAKV